MADIFPYWRINGGNKKQRNGNRRDIYCRDSAEINGCSSLQTLSWLDSQELRNRQQNIPPKRYGEL